MNRIVKRPSARTSTLAGLAFASLMLTPLAVGLVGSESASASEPSQVASLTETSATTQIAAPKAEAATEATKTAAVSEDGVCARKVKVVYPGYGTNTACAPTLRP